jgi:hypothetical protein
MSDVKFGRSVNRPRFSGIDGADEAPVVGRLAEGVRKRISENEGEAVNWPLGHGNLQAVVVRKIAVRKPRNIRQIWKLGGVRLSSHLTTYNCV